jgi:hypothetical protein
MQPHVLGGIIQYVWLGLSLCQLICKIGDCEFHVPAVASALGLAPCEGVIASDVID